MPGQPQVRRIGSSRTNVPKSRKWSLRVPCPPLWSDPPGVPGVACRRGTGGCPGIMSEPGARVSVYLRQFGPWCGYRATLMSRPECGGNILSPPAPRSRRQTLNPAHAGFSFLGRDLTSEHSPASTGKRSDPTRLGRGLLCSDLSYPPQFVGSPKQGARPSARLCDGVGSCRPTPCAQPSTAATGEERSGRDHGRGRRTRFWPSAKTTRRAPSSA